MASPGLLFLLLVSSSLLLSNVSTSPDQTQVLEIPADEINKHIERLKNVVNLFRENADKIRFAVVPLIALIPGWGTQTAAVLTSILVGVSNKNDAVLTTVVSEFQSLNIKLDKYHQEQKWDIWASSVYHKPEMDITVAWTTYMTLLNALKLAKNEAEKESHIKDFIKTYAKYEPATKTLDVLLKDKGTTFISKLGDMLAEQLRCHEKDIIEYTVFINELIMKGTFLNGIYYSYKKIMSPARDAEATKIAYNAASAMFKIHKTCILKSMKYIKLDVEELINDHKDRQELAKKITLFLSQTYDRYDWMVVAFLTKNSEHKIRKTENRHQLSGFTNIARGEVTVAVARQVKGKYTKTRDLKAAIDKCFSKPVLCSKVEKKLEGCVSRSYTAVHAFIDKPHHSYTTRDSSPIVPYIHTGLCEKTPGIKGGQFVVMIKSDEEIEKKNPCDNLKCNGGKDGGNNGGTTRGKCVRADDTFVAMCECKDPYYGQQCELSSEDYKESLESEGKAVGNSPNKRPGPKVVDSRKRTKPRNI